MSESELVTWEKVEQWFTVMAFAFDDPATLRYMANKAIKRGKELADEGRLATILHIRRVAQEHPNYSHADIAAVCNTSEEFVDVALLEGRAAEVGKVFRADFKMRQERAAKRRRP